MLTMIQWGPPRTSAISRLIVRTLCRSVSGEACFVSVRSPPEAKLGCCCCNAAQFARRATMRNMIMVRGGDQHQTHSARYRCIRAAGWHASRASKLSRVFFTRIECKTHRSEAFRSAIMSFRSYIQHSRNETRNREQNRTHFSNHDRKS